MQRRIAVVFGTRSEAIKMAPVVHELYARSEVVCKSLWRQKSRTANSLMCRRQKLWVDFG